ncbi:MAG: class E sortase [Micrococcales bacterium]|nr:class E sortase [Micrococcales bacterium]
MSRATVRTIGELMMTLGALVLLFVVWQLWWTDVESNRVQAKTLDSLQQQFGATGQPKTTDRPAAKRQDAKDVATAVTLDQAFGIIRIPRFGADYARPIFEGTNHEILDEGVGHYTGTAKPGEVGNFSVAGHRVTYGKPFNQIHTLVPGDRIIVETKAGFATYVVQSHQIVLPSQGEVIAPVPDKPGAKPTERWMTLTACHPMFSARERYIVHAKLESTYPRSAGLPESDLQLGG